jgi:hypothetical protein
MKVCKDAKDMMLLFVAQVINYGLMVVNYRAVAHASYFWSGLSDFALASFSFFIIKKIAKSEDSWHLWLGYALGGLVGSLLGIWISLQIHGK